MLYYMYILNTDTSDSVEVHVLDETTASSLLIDLGEYYFYLSLLISALSARQVDGTDLFDDADCG